MGQVSVHLIKLKVAQAGTDLFEFFSLSIDITHKLHWANRLVSMSLLQILPTMRVLQSPSLVEKEFPITFP